MMPVELLLDATELPGVKYILNEATDLFIDDPVKYRGHKVFNLKRVGIMDRTRFNETAYYDLADRILKHTRENLNTKVLASHFLRTMNKEDAKSVIVFHLFWQPEITSLVHGLAALGITVIHHTGPDANVFPKFHRNTTIEEMDEYRDSVLFPGYRSHGFMYGFRTDREYFSACTHQECIDLITNRNVDLIIYSVTSPTLWYQYDDRWPYFAYVRRHYSRDEIAIIDGSDGADSFRPEVHDRMCETGVLFTRESPDPDLVFNKFEEGE
jgi:hypothetical protein